MRKIGNSRTVAQKYFDKLFLIAIGALQLERNEIFRVELRVRDQQRTLTL